MKAVHLSDTLLFTVMLSTGMTKIKFMRWGMGNDQRMYKTVIKP